MLAADMVGFTRLIERDETGTLARQKVLRSEVIEPMIARHKGNFIKHTGDGWIAEFSSAISAAKCALALQSELSKHAESGSGDDRIAYRIAMHLGDLVFDEGDIFGDGVNVAARLEALAPQGGIVVSGTVRDLLKNQADFTLEDKGAHQLKNVSEPVRVYELVASERSKQHLTNRRPKHILPRRSIGAVGGAVLALVIGLMFFMESAPETHLTSEEPSIVVMPFENLSEDPTHSYLANGLTEDITTDLSQLP